MSEKPRTGRLLGLGVGPGDPELITVKALRLLEEAEVVAYYAAKNKKGNAFSTIEGYLRPNHVLMPMIYPVTTERLPQPFSYDQTMQAFYNEMAAQIAMYLDAGQDVAALCEGDPFFYGSFMYLHDRLSHRYPTEVVPGVCAMVTCASALGTPLVYRNQTLKVLSGVMPGAELKRQLADADAAAVMKLGTHFKKVRQVIGELGLQDRALYIERASMAEERRLPLATVDPTAVPYFSMILIPGKRWRETA